MFASTSSSVREPLSTSPVSTAQAVGMPVAQGLSDGLSQVQSLNRSAGSGAVPEPNNSFAQALNIGSVNGTRTFTDFVGSSDLNDYYRFTLSGNRLNLSLTGLGADADVRIYNAAGTQIGSSARGGSAEESINLSGLTNGATYYARVHRFSGNTNYTLRLSNSSPNNLITNETNVGSLSGTRNFSGSVGNSDTSDVYRFTLGSTSNLTARLTGLSADADVRIIRDANFNGVVDAGEEVLRSAAGGSASELINLRGLGSGSYIAQVYQFSGNTNYSLQLSASAGAGVATESNNTIAQAYNIGTLNGFRQFSGFVGSSDTNDYYRFNLGATSNFSLNLSGLSADADVQIIRDSNGNGVIDAGESIISSTRAGSAAESINLQGLGAGNYITRVYRFSGNTNYSLGMSATPGVGFATESNNSIAQAYNIGTLNGSRQFVGSVSTSDTNDYYRFSVGGNRNVNLTLNGLSADADIRLYNSAGTLITSSTNGGTSADSIIRTLATGTYYVQVSRFSGSPSYTLNLSAA